MGGSATDSAMFNDAVSPDSTFYPENTIWPMLAFHLALGQSFHIEGYTTTLLNGAAQDSGMWYIIHLISNLIINMIVCKCEELFNLHHSSARNIIKRIFGILKNRFFILVIAPTITWIYKHGWLQRLQPYIISDFMIPTRFLIYWWRLRTYTCKGCRARGHWQIVNEMALHRVCGLNISQNLAE